MSAVLGAGSVASVQTHESKKSPAKPLDTKIVDTFTGFITTHLKPFQAAVESFYLYLQESKKDPMKTLPRFDLKYGKSLTGDTTNFIVAFETLQIADPESSEQQLLNLRDRALACAYLLAFQKAAHQMQDSDLPAYEKVQSILEAQSIIPIDRVNNILLEVLKRNGVTDLSDKRAVFSAVMKSLSSVKLTLEEHACFCKLTEYVLTYELSAEQVDTPFPISKIAEKA